MIAAVILSTLSTTCTPTVTKFTGQNAPGLTQKGLAATYNESACIALCIATPGCLSVDYNNQDLTCFFGFTANPSLQPNGPVDHFNIVPCNATGSLCYNC